MNEIRNELLEILQMEKETNEKDKKLRLELLLERFEYDIKDKLEDLERNKEELEGNLRTLEYVKKELFK